MDEDYENILAEFSDDSLEEANDDSYCLEKVVDQNHPTSLKHTASPNEGKIPTEKAPPLEYIPLCHAPTDDSLDWLSSTDDDETPDSTLDDMLYLEQTAYRYFKQSETLPINESTTTFVEPNPVVNNNTNRKETRGDENKKRRVPKKQSIRILGCTIKNSPYTRQLQRALFGERVKGLQVHRAQIPGTPLKHIFFENTRAFDESAQTLLTDGSCSVLLARQLAPCDWDIWPAVQKHIRNPKMRVFALPDCAVYAVTLFQNHPMIIPMFDTKDGRHVCEPYLFRYGEIEDLVKGPLEKNVTIYVAYIHPEYINAKTTRHMRYIISQRHTNGTFYHCSRTAKSFQGTVGAPLKHLDMQSFGLLTILTINPWGEMRIYIPADRRNMQMVLEEGILLRRLASVYPLEQRYMLRGLMAYLEADEKYSSLYEHQYAPITKDHSLRVENIYQHLKRYVVPCSHLEDFARGWQAAIDMIASLQERNIPIVQYVTRLFTHTIEDTTNIQRVLSQFARNYPRKND